MAKTSSKVELWNRALQLVGETLRLQAEDDRRPAGVICNRVHDDFVEEVLEARRWPWAKRQRPIVNIDTQTVTYLYADYVGVTVFDAPAAVLDNDLMTVTHISSGGTETELEAGADYTIADADEEAALPTRVTLDSSLAASESLRIDIEIEREGWEHLFALPEDCVTPIALLGDGQRFDLMPVDERIEWAKLLNDAGDWYIIGSNHDADDFDKLEYICVVAQLQAWPRNAITALAYRFAMELALGLKKDQALHERLTRLYLVALEQAWSHSMKSQGETNKGLTPSLASRG